MKTGDKRKICWDCTCWLAWLKGEGTDIWPQKVVRGLYEVVNEVENNEAILFTSSIVRIEILDSRLTDKQKETFQKLLRRSNVSDFPPLVSITDKAAEIRACTDKDKRVIKTPDAIYLATAIIYEADEFQTMDGLGKNESKRKLLALNGTACVDGLTIIQPYPLTDSPPKKIGGIDGPMFPLAKGKDKAGN